MLQTDKRANRFGSRIAEYQINVVTTDRNKQGTPMLCPTGRRLILTGRRKNRRSERRTRSPYTMICLS